MRFLHKIGLITVALLFLSGCQKKQELNIISGSENEALSPLFLKFESETGIKLNVTYKGSIDIMQEISQGKETEYDIAWPANSIWLTLGDKNGIVGEQTSIMRSPIVWGVKKSKVQELGWQNGDVGLEDIAKAIESGKLKYAMTSATQSNSGAMAYLAMYSAVAGKTLKIEDLNDKNSVYMNTILSGVNRSSGSSGWLKNLYLENTNLSGDLDGMVNYESLIIETNLELQNYGKEPLCVIYPRDSATIADHPLAFLNKNNTNNSEKKESYEKLKTWLLSDEVQQKIADMGRRTSNIGVNYQYNENVFRKDWCVDTNRIISPLRLPSEDVIRTALEMYQNGLRKPSHSVFLLDVSGSMEGIGINQMVNALNLVFSYAESRKYFINPGQKDTITLIPFDNKLYEGITLSGNKEEDMNTVLWWVAQNIRPHGGTNFYPGIVKANEILSAHGEESLKAIVVMTDGASDDCSDNQNCDGSVVRQMIKNGEILNGIPVFSITFGNADTRQLDVLAKMTNGRVLDGRKDLIKAFRDVKGYF